MSASDEDADLKFTQYLIEKVDQIREDLGATGELFDEATHRCLIDGENPDDVKRELDVRIEQARLQSSMDADNTVVDTAHLAAERLKVLAEELDLDPQAQHDTLDTAMSVGAGRPQLSAFDERQRCKVLRPDLAGWSDTIDETVRRSVRGGGLGPVPQLAFSPEPFIEPNHGQPIFRLRDDTEFVHLSHPLMTRAISTLTRRRFPGALAVSRWTVRFADVPPGAEAVIVLHLEELAINELRETFHHWMRTLRIPVKKGELLKPLPHVSSLRLRGGRTCTDPVFVDRARGLLSDVRMRRGRACWRCFG